MNKESLFYLKRIFHITNTPAWFALLISIVSLFLTIKYRPDQFAAIRYEQQLEALSEISSLIMEAQAYIFPYILLDKKIEEKNHLIKRIVSLKENIHMFNSEFITVNERMALLDKEDHDLFLINWNNIEVFSLDSITGDLKKEDIQDVDNFISLLLSKPFGSVDSEKNLIGFGILDKNKKPSPDSLFRVFVVDPTEKVMKLFSKIDDFIKKKGGIIEENGKLIKKFKHFTEEIELELADITKTQKSLNREINELISRLGDEDYSSFWYKFQKTCSKYLLLFPVDVFNSLNAYMFFGLSLTSSKEELEEMMHILEYGKTQLNEYGENPINIDSINEMIKNYSDTTLNTKNSKNLFQRHINELMAVFKVLNRYAPTPLIEETLHDIVYNINRDPSKYLRISPKSL